MSKYIYRFAAPLAVAFAIVAGACSDTKKNDTLAEDTSLNRDLQMANQDTAAQPALQDVPATGTPSTSAPVASAPVRTAPRSSGSAVRTPPRTTATRPAATRPSTPTTTASGNTVTTGTSGSERSRVGTIAAGSEITLTSNSRVCTNTHHEYTPCWTAIQRDGEQHRNRVERRGDPCGRDGDGRDHSARPQ
jgi:hypothetical protein